MIERPVEYGPADLSADSIREKVSEEGVISIS